MRRDYDGRFAGFRINVESVPRLPARVAREALGERRPQIALWVNFYDDQLAYVSVVEPTADRNAVRIRKGADPSGEMVTVAARELPWDRTDLLLVCPGCRRPRRHLYPWQLIASRVVDTGRFRCQACSGLRFASQGSYRSALHRALGGPNRYVPLPRSPWEPQVMNDPDAILRAFPGEITIVRR